MKNRNVPLRIVFKEWILDNLILIYIGALVLLLVVMGFINHNELLHFREERGMIFIEEGLVYNEETKVIYQEIPSTSSRGFLTGKALYFPFYDANNEVILYNE